MSSFERGGEGDTALVGAGKCAEAGKSGRFNDRFKCAGGEGCDVVEEALAEALRRACEAGEWGIVEPLVRELEARRWRCEVRTPERDAECLTRLLGKDATRGSRGLTSPPPRGTLSGVKPVEASYENGLLRPAKPLPLGEGEHVQLIVVRKPDPGRWDLDRIAAVADGEDLELAEAGLEQWVSDLDTEDAKSK